MKMALNFADVAKQKLNEIERPPLPPTGEYRFQIPKLPDMRTSDDGKWDFCTFNVKALEAVTADLSDYAGDVTNILQRVQFMFNKEDETEFKRTLFNLRRFLEDHVQCADPSDDLMQAINKSVNQQFLGTITWKPDKNDPEIQYANITRTAPLA